MPVENANGFAEVQTHTSPLKQDEHDLGDNGGQDHPFGAHLTEYDQQAVEQQVDRPSCKIDAGEQGLLAVDKNHLVGQHDIAQPQQAADAENGEREAGRQIGLVSVNKHDGICHDADPDRHGDSQHEKGAGGGMQQPVIVFLPVFPQISGQARNRRQYNCVDDVGDELRDGQREGVKGGVRGSILGKYGQKQPVQRGVEHAGVGQQEHDQQRLDQSGQIPFADPAEPYLAFDIGKAAQVVDQKDEGGNEGIGQDVSGLTDEYKNADDIQYADNERFIEDEPVIFKCLVHPLHEEGTGNQLNGEQEIKRDQGGRRDEQRVEQINAGHERGADHPHGEQGGEKGFQTDWVFFGLADDPDPVIVYSQRGKRDKPADESERTVVLAIEFDIEDVCQIGAGDERQDDIEDIERHLGHHIFGDGFRHLHPCLFRRTDIFRVNLNRNPNTVRHGVLVRIRDGAITVLRMNGPHGTDKRVLEDSRGLSSGGLGAYDGILLKECPEIIRINKLNAGHEGCGGNEQGQKQIPAAFFRAGEKIGKQRKASEQQKTDATVEQQRDKNRPQDQEHGYFKERIISLFVGDGLTVVFVDHAVHEQHQRE